MTIPKAAQAARLLTDATPLVSTDAGNALTVGADKKLKMLPGTPSAHASTHNAGGSDALALAGAATATAAGTAGLVTYAADNAPNTTRNQAATPASVDKNITDRLAGATTTPSAHAASHNAGGTDALAAGTAATATANGTVGLAHAAAGNAPDTDWQGWVSPAFLAAKRVRAAASTTLTAALAANTALTVPSYPMGANKIQVFLNGAFCNQGATNTYAYKEASATTITFWDALVVGDVVDVIVVQ